MLSKSTKRLKHAEISPRPPQFSVEQGKESATLPYFSLPTALEIPSHETLCTSGSTWYECTPQGGWRHKGGGRCANKYVSLWWARKSQNSLLWDFEISIKFIILRHLSASSSHISTCSVRVHPYTHMFAFCPFVLEGFGCSKCACAKMTCVELYVGVQPVMKLGSRRKVVSMRMYSISSWTLTCDKKYALELLVTNLLVTAAFLRCRWMLLFWRSRVHSTSQILKICQACFLTKGPVFACSPTNDLQRFRERRRRERRKFGDFTGNIVLNLP